MTEVRRDTQRSNITSKTKCMKPIPVLLVDDDEELCSSLQRLLKMDGFGADAVHDADSGIRQALKGEYELVILDVMMPGGDGRKVLRRIRLTSQVPVIMLTARGAMKPTALPVSRAAPMITCRSPSIPANWSRACALFSDAKGTGYVENLRHRRSAH